MRFFTNRITRQKGFTRKELIVVLAVIGVISILLSIFCSKLAKAYTRAGRIKCSNNLKEISLAFRMYAGDNNGKFPMASESAEVELSNKLQVWQYFQSVSNHLGSPKLLLCPRDKNKSASEYSSSKDGLAHPSKQNRAISYFLGIYSSESMVNSILAGDRTLTAPNMSKLYTSNGTNAVEVTSDSVWSSAPMEANHDGFGNLALVDGSVQPTMTAGLQPTFRMVRNTYGTNANRFLFPQ